MALSQDIIDYYVDLLIAQYRNKPKARATIEDFVRDAFFDGVLFELRDAFNIDTAVGENLDIIGKYVGVDRNYTNSYIELSDIPYFSFRDNTNSEVSGFRGREDNLPDGRMVDDRDIVSNSNLLLDEVYRDVIRLKIIANNSNNSPIEIAEQLNILFPNTSFFIPDRVNRTIIFFSGNESLIDVFIEKDVIPIPVGTSVRITNYNRNIFSFRDSNIRLESKAGFRTDDTSEGGFINNLISI